MSATLAIARRELIEKRFVFITSAALSIVPLLTALLPGAQRVGAANLVSVTAGFLAIAIPLGLAIGLGATTIGRDLSERRLSFYFAKPIPAAAIWWGKVLAALLTVLASFVILIAPTFLFYGKRWQTTWNIDALALAGFVLEAAVVLFFGAHAVSTVMRSRSLFIAVDLALLCVMLFVAWLILQPLADGWALELLGFTGLALGVLLLIALAAAGAWQLSRGRADARASHRAFSSFFWPVAAVLLLLTGLFVAWVVRAEPDDLRYVEVEPAPTGPWTFVTGTAPGRGDYRPLFLVNMDDASYYRVPRVSWRHFRDLGMFSGDGKSLIMPERMDLRGQRFELVLRRLDALDDEPLRTSVTIGPYARYVLSDDGARLALFDRGTLSVYDLRSKALLAAMRVPQTAALVRARMFFRDANTLRLYLELSTNNRAHRLTILECNVPSKQLRELATIPIPGRYLGFVVSPDGSRLLVRDVSEPAVTRGLLFSDDGTQLASIAAPGTQGSAAVRLLRDGRLAATSVTGKQATLRIYSAAGAQELEMPIGPAVGASITGDTPDGKLLVSTRNWDYEVPVKDRTWTTYVVDPAARRIVRSAPIRPSFDWALMWGDTDPRIRIRPRPQLAFTKDWQVVRWDVQTGEMKTLFGVRQP